VAAACVPNVFVQSADGTALAVLWCWQCLTEAAESTAAAGRGRQVAAAAELVQVDTVAAAACKN